METIPEPPNSVDVCQAVGGAEISPYIAEWQPQDGGPGASYVGEELCLPADAGTQQLAFAPIADGLGLFAHQGIWRRPGIIRGWIELPEPYLEVRLPFTGATRIVGATGAQILETPRLGTLNIETPGAPCEHHNPVGEPNSRLAALVTASHLATLFGEDPLSDHLRFIHHPGAWPTVNAAIPMTSQLRQIGSEMLHNAMPPALTRLFLTAKAIELLTHVLADYAQPARHMLDSDRPNARDRRLAERAREMLFADLGHPLLVHELARSVGLSQRKLNALFRVLYGGTVLQCLGHWRMELAQEWLISDSLSIKEIAFRLGYDHCNNFIAAFQKRVGVPPGTFRATHGMTNKIVVALYPSDSSLQGDGDG